MSSLEAVTPDATTTTSYWCYRCSGFVRVPASDAIVCPDCNGGFLELVEPPQLPLPSADPRRGQLPASSMYLQTNPSPASSASSARVGNRSRRRSGDRSPFNPVIVLRGQSEGVGDGVVDRPTSSFELYYDDGTGSGLRPLPPSMSEFLMGSGFDRLLDQLAQIEVNGIGGRSCEHPPASKAAVELMPTIVIEEDHVGLDSHCAVCKEPFEVGTEVREMPCQHIYHQDCILPWLSLRNSCPVCRHEMPTDVRGGRGAQELDSEHTQIGANEEQGVGLTIWRLPGGGFAVGRFSGGRRAAERELPVVYTEMDGGFNNSGAPRRISWRSSRSRRHNSGIGRFFNNVLSVLGCFRSTPSPPAASSRISSESASSLFTRSRTGSVFGRRSSRRSNSSWVLEDGSASGMSRW